MSVQTHRFEGNVNLSIVYVTSGTAPGQLHYQAETKELL